MGDETQGKCNHVLNYFAFNCLCSVFGGISKVKWDNPLYKLISSYAAKYKSDAYLIKHTTWMIEVNKIYRAAKIRGSIHVADVIQDMIGLNDNQVAILSANDKFVATLGNNEERTLSQRLNDILNHKHDEDFKSSKKSSTKTSLAVADVADDTPRKKRASRTAVAASDDIVGELTDNLKIVTNDQLSTSALAQQRIPTSQRGPDVLSQLEGCLQN